MRLVLLSAASAGAIVLAACDSAAVVPAASAEKAITVTAAPVPLYRDRPADIVAGKLIYRAGVVLTSPEPRFGGFSGMRISADGRSLLAITDEGNWLSATLAPGANGLGGLENVRMAAGRSLDGTALADKVAADAEAVAAIPEASFPGLLTAVSFEQDHRIWLYRGAEPMSTTPVALAGPDFGALRKNGGLEALVALDGARLLAIAEDAADGLHPAWIVPVDGGPGERLSIKETAPFGITDATLAPGGDLLLLARRFSVAGGLGVRVLRVPATAVVPGATIEPEVLADFTQEASIDNFEAISARTGESGETLIYLLADDNFNAPAQRTVMMLFALAPAAP